MRHPRRTLPGGAELVERDGRRAAVRPGAGVAERVRGSGPAEPEKDVTVGVLEPGDRLKRIKLIVEVTAGLVALLGAVLALLGLSRK